MKFQLDSFIDIHTHILPGLDDGAKDMQESIELARLFESSGVKKVVATPHFLPGTAWAFTKEKVLESVESLQTSLDSEGIDLKIFPGMEIGFHKKMADRILNDNLLPLGDSQYYLVEPSFHGEQDIFIEQLASLLNKNQKLIVAHPERIEGFKKNLDTLEKLVDKGLRIQVNGGSLLGKFGKRSKSMARELQKRNCIHFIASDTHDCHRRSPLTPAEWEELQTDPEGTALLASCKENLTRIFEL